MGCDVVRVLLLLLFVRLLLLLLLSHHVGDCGWDVPRPRQRLHKRIYMIGLLVIVGQPLFHLLLLLSGRSIAAVVEKLLVSKMVNEKHVKVDFQLC